MRIIPQQIGGPNDALSERKASADCAPAPCSDDAWKLVHKYDHATFASPLPGTVERLYDPEHWSIRRRNKTSGKSQWHCCAFGMTEYVAKTLCNAANMGSSCEQHQVISPQGEVFELRVPDLRQTVEMIERIARSTKHQDQIGDIIKECAKVNHPNND